MEYYKFYEKENLAIRERYDLAMERIGLILCEDSVPEQYRGFFREQAEFLLLLKELCELSEKGEYRKLPLEQLQDINKKLYGTIRDDYQHSYLNPDFAKLNFGEQYGKYLMWLGVSLRSLIEPALSVKLEQITLYAEVFIEIYNLFESEDLYEKNLKDIIYWFNHDCCEILYDYNVREMVDWDYNFATTIIMEENLDDLKYLYYYGSNITNNEIETANLLKSFPPEKIEAIAKTYTDGFIKGFKIAGKDLSKKESVELRYSIGFERVIKAAIKRLQVIGLKPVIRRASYTTTPASRQYGYDHRYIDGPIFDKCIKDRRIEVYKQIFDKYHDRASKMSGPAVIETFGEKPFSPENKKSAVKYNDKQQKLKTDINREYMEIVQQHIKQEERSFTIIAYPIADIGSNYRDIFEDTIKINNLDEELYRQIQTHLINALDKGKKVEIKGMNGNKTNLIVNLAELKDPKKETLFENCLADVNIPLGEVFTSPRLKGTEGVLNVSKVYLKGLNYENLTLHFKDGCVNEYSCDNFDDKESGKSYIKENLLNGHRMLPMGEFAIGTNTTAYVIGKKYNIIPLMPILIVEKMGPHFAVGDTCYSYEEEEKTYNPDGKQIIAKANEFSKEYFNCHTDITIPYDELGEINVIMGDESRVAIIKEGRFVLEGTEVLNEAFSQ